VGCSEEGSKEGSGHAEKVTAKKAPANPVKKVEAKTVKPVEPGTTQQ